MFDGRRRVHAVGVGRGEQGVARDGVIARPAMAHFAFV